QDPNYWQLREAQATKTGKPEIQWASPIDKKHLASFFDPSMRGKYGSPPLPPPGFKHSTKGKMKAVVNTPPPGFVPNRNLHFTNTPFGSRVEEPIFKVRHIKDLPKNSSIFFSLFDPHEAQMQNHLQSFSLGGKAKEGKEPALSLAAVRHSPTTAEGILVIPTPQNHELIQLRLSNRSGRVLREGEDYQIFARTDGTSGYSVKVAKPDTRAGIEIEAKFAATAAAKTVHAFDRRFTDLDLEKVRRLNSELKDMGFQSLSQAIDLKLNTAKREKTQVSVEALSEVFSQSSFYTYIPEPEGAAALGSQEKRFSKFTKFLVNGTLCLQCNGSTGLFNEFMAAYFSDDPLVQVDVQLGYLTERREILPRDYHVQTVFKLNGEFALTVNATARMLDPRMQNQTDARGDAKKTEDLFSRLKKIDDSDERLNALAQAQSNISPELFEKQKKAEKVRRYLQVLQERRVALKGAIQEIGIKPSRTDPTTATIYLASALEDLLKNNDTVESLRARLEKLLPHYKHDYADNESVFNFVANVMRQERARVEKMTSNPRRLERVEGYQHYLDGGFLDMLSELQHHLGADPKMQLPTDDELAAFWEVGPTLKNLDPTTTALSSTSEGQKRISSDQHSQNPHDQGKSQGRSSLMSRKWCSLRDTFSNFMRFGSAR
ncbi:MAG: hypothetical protein AB1540_09700, partial [Bdellovibrionota bacterium]